MSCYCTSSDFRQLYPHIIPLLEKPYYKRGPLAHWASCEITCTPCPDHFPFMHTCTHSWSLTSTLPACLISEHSSMQETVAVM